MTEFFTLGNINELVLKGHSYISTIGLKIIKDKNCKGSSFLESHFFDFLELLEVIELRKDIETTDSKLQQLVLRLSGIVENECIYYNSKYLDIDNPMFNGSVIVDTSNLVTQEQLEEAINSLNIGNQKTKLDITDNTNPTVIDWINDLVPEGILTWKQKHGSLGYVHNAKWKPSGSPYEKNDGYSITDEYDNDGELISVVINVSDLPFRFIFL